MTDRQRPDPDGDGPYSRRQVIAAASGALVGGAAGCGGTGEPTDADTDSPTPTPFPTVEVIEATPTPPSEAPADETTPTVADDDIGPLQSVVMDSPSAAHAPGDGFADLSWLDDRDLEVVRVTTLDGAGEGSLRRALDRQGPRLVVFEVGGVIDLEHDPITIERGQGAVFVAGQTAPEPGVTLVREALGIEAENVVIQHLRVRPGTDIVAPAEEGDAEGHATDAVEVRVQRAKNVAIDHCSVTWGSDETMSVGSDCPVSGNGNVTFSNNIIAEGLHDTELHPETSHGYGTLVHNCARRVSIYGTVWAHNAGRHPLLKQGTTSAIVNNVAYDFEDGTTFGVLEPERAYSSIVGNLYRAGPNTATHDGALPVVELDDMVSAYLADNVAEPSDLRIYSSRHEGHTGAWLLEEPTVMPARLAPFPAEEVLDHNLRAAGARPAERTPHDQRIVADVREGTGDIIDSQAEVGGYPDLEATSRPLDVPSEPGALADWLAGHTAAVELPDADPP